MLRSSREERALEAVTEEARRQATPELSDQLEERLLEAISKTPVACGKRPDVASRFTWLIPVAGLCSAAAAVWALWPLPVDLAPPPAIVQPAAELDGDTLRPERVLTATHEALEVRHAGRARWRLERGGEAVVLESNDAIRVRLIRGAIRAEVVPNPAPERFVVEAGETRVAVHGTIFRVSLEEDGSVVDVDEGTVKVAPLRGVASESLFLRGPSRGRFGHDGRLKPAPVPYKKAERAALLRRVAPEPSASPSAMSPAGVSRELTIGEVEAGVATVVQAITRCFEEHTATDGDVRIHVQTSVMLTIAPDGAVVGVTLSPPLSPAVQACSERDAGMARFAPSLEGARVTRVIELSR